MAFIIKTNDIQRCREPLILERKIVVEMEENDPSAT